MARYSDALLILSLLQLLAVPFVDPSAAWTLFSLGIASFLGAVISFFTLND